MRVLVVEDNHEFRASLVEALRDAGHDVAEAVDGAVALRWLQETAEVPDVIVLDLMMPNMDGRLFRIRQLADQRLASIPTVVTTAMSVDPATRSVLGYTPVLSKPLSLDSFLAALEAVAEPPGNLKHCSCGRV